MIQIIHMKKILLSLALVSLAMISTHPIEAAESRDEKVRADKTKVESSGLWIYNNLDYAILEAKRSNKPILVTFRCIP